MATLRLMHDDVVLSAPLNDNQVDLRSTDELALADDFESEDDAYGDDPMAILERREQERGTNVFGHPIN